MGKARVRCEKEAYVEGLFSSVAGKYDLMNSVLSLSRHKAWRRFAVSKAGLKPGDSALDVCCGTGDFAFELARVVGKADSSLARNDGLADEPGTVVGVDFSRPMIELAERKAARQGNPNVSFLEANACDLPFPDEAFDGVTVGFGVRNLADIDAGLAEMARVLRPGGRLVCLETSEMRSRPLRRIWRLFFRLFSPSSAMMFGAKRSAYQYLPRSAAEFLSREELAGKFEKHDLTDVTVFDLMFGTVCVHVGTKR